jgi:hypothetical protein
MFRLIVLIPLIGFSISVSAQNYRKIDSLEKLLKNKEDKLIKELESLVVIYARDTFKYEKVEAVRDSMLKRNFQRRKRFRQINNDYSFANYYNNNQIFKEVVDFVRDSISHVTAGNLLDKIHSKIMSIDSFLPLYYIQAEFHAKDIPLDRDSKTTKKLSVIVKDISNRIDNFSKIERDNIFLYSIFIGDYFSKHDFIQSLFYYTNVLKYCDSINNLTYPTLTTGNMVPFTLLKIGDLYFERKYPNYIKKSVLFYNNAIKEYRIINEEEGILISNLKLANALMSPEYQNLLRPNTLDNIIDEKTPLLSLHEEDNALHYLKTFRQKTILNQLNALESLGNNLMLASSTYTKYSPYRHLYLLCVGLYFQNKQDLNDINIKQAIAQYSLGVITMFEDSTYLQKDYLYMSLYQLSILYSLQNDSRAETMLRYAYSIALLEKDYFNLSLSLIKFGVNNLNNKKISIGVAAIDSGIVIAHGKVKNSEDQKKVYIEGYRALVRHYRTQGNSDSLKKYDELLSVIERTYDEELSITQSLVDGLNEFKINSLIALQNKDISNKERTITLRTVSGIIAFIILFIVSAYIYVIRSKSKNAMLRYLQARLTNHARAKIHNIANNYTMFTNLLDTNQYLLANKYADATSYYYSISLRNLRDTSWTVSKEWFTLESYYDTESILGVKVKLKKLFRGFDEHNTKFIPEIFSTLLNNSMKHAFSNNKQKNVNTFKIQVEKHKLNLHFEVSDNGLPSPIEKYISDQNPDGGLYILRQRIVNECKRAGLKLSSEEIFKIEVDINTGTKIKFIYPYAKAH